MQRSKPILITQSVMAGLGILLGGAALGDFVDPRYIGLGVLLLGAIQGGLAFYLSHTNTPSATVVATQETSGAPVIAGPASASVTGAMLSPQSRVVDVVPSAPSDVNGV